MNSNHNHSTSNGDSPQIDADLLMVSDALDRIGQADRDAAPADFESRMASTTMFALSAGLSSSTQGHAVGHSRLWLRLAAAVALISAGAIAWTMTRSPAGLTGEPGPKIARTTPATNAASEGDDSEVYSLVALALDGGLGSDVDFLATDASDLHNKIGESPSIDDLLEGSTM